MTVPALHPNDLMDELVNLRRELATANRMVKEMRDLTTAQAEVLAAQDGEQEKLTAMLCAGNSIIAEQSTAIATAHSALLAGNVDYAIEILAGRHGGRS